MILPTPGYLVLPGSDTGVFPGPWRRACRTKTLELADSASQTQRAGEQGLTSRSSSSLRFEFKEKAPSWSRQTLVLGQARGCDSLSSHHRGRWPSSSGSSAAPSTANSDAVLRNVRSDHVRCEHGERSCRACGLPGKLGPRVDTACGLVCPPRSLRWDLRVLAAVSLGLFRQGRPGVGRASRAGLSLVGWVWFSEVRGAGTRLRAVTEEQALPGTAGTCCARSGLAWPASPLSLLPAPWSLPGPAAGSQPLSSHRSLGLGLPLGLGFLRPCRPEKRFLRQDVHSSRRAPGVLKDRQRVGRSAEGPGADVFPGWPPSHPRSAPVSV